MERVWLAEGKCVDREAQVIELLANGRERESIADRAHPIIGGYMIEGESGNSLNELRRTLTKVFVMVLHRRAC